MKIGIIKEFKTPEDHRVPLSPEQCAELKSFYPELDIVVQPYEKRCFSNQEYQSHGIQLQEDLSSCDFLMGIKEVPVEKLIPNKTYFFFSHTLKEQAQNKNLIQALLAHKIRMIDYEPLTNEAGKRVIGFGKWAGIVGAQYALMMWTKKNGGVSIPTCQHFDNYNSLKDLYDSSLKSKIPPHKIVVTGKGNVGMGVIELLQIAGLEQVDKREFLSSTKITKPQFTVLEPEDYYAMKNGEPLDVQSFYKDGSIAKSSFKPFTQAADILINAMYWDPKAPRLFQKEEVKTKDFKISVIADITCDVEGSVPLTLRQTSSENPFIGIDRKTSKEVCPFQENNASLDIMAVGNLPNELPKDASHYFGEVIKNIIIPELLKKEKSIMLERATITQNGKLGCHFQYLNNYAFGK